VPKVKKERINNKEFAKELKKRTRKSAVRIIHLSSQLPNTPEGNVMMNVVSFSLFLPLLQSNFRHFSSL
jgi:hypothetical protein